MQSRDEIAGLVFFRGGLRLRHSSRGRDLGSAIPHSPRRRGPCNNWKKAHRAPGGALFFVHRPSLMQASLQRSVRVQKSPQALLESFFRCCGERGIRTWRAARVLRVSSIIFEKCCLCATLFVYLACKI